MDEQQIRLATAIRDAIRQSAYELVLIDDSLPPGHMAREITSLIDGAFIPRVGDTFWIIDPAREEGALVAKAREVIHRLGLSQDGLEDRGVVVLAEYVDPPSRKKSK